MARYEPQRFECAGALGFIFQKEYIDVQFVEELFCNRAVAPFGIPLAPVVTSAKVNRENHSVSLGVLRTGVIYADRFVERLLRIDTHFIPNPLPPLRI